MGVAEDVMERCEKALDATFVECVDVSDGNCSGAKLQLTVVSNAFAGLPLLKRHRKVNECFADLSANGTIHAVTIKAWTPEQYQDKN